jgi:type II restriction enzyme
MADSRFDFAVLSRNVPTNVEVNFYGGTGSKPSEIVNAYSDRAHALRQYGWRLVWVTDGPGWLKMRNPLRKGVTDIDYVLNLQMASDGLLERILLEH